MGRVESSKKAIMIIGASGTMAQAFLTYFLKFRNLFGNLVLLDKQNFDESSLTLQDLDAIFIHAKIVNGDEQKLISLINKNRVEYLIDLSTISTEFMMNVLKKCPQTSYICTSFCTSQNESLGESLNAWINKNKLYKPKKPHIFFSGMNPGVVNLWAEIGVKKFGVPSEIIEFEYDSSDFQNLRCKEKLITWCISDFVEEFILDPSEEVLGRNNVRSIYPNSLSNTVGIKKYLDMISNQKERPIGCVVGHEECFTLGNKYNIPFKYIYSVNARTMKFLKNSFNEKGKIEDSNLVIGDNKSAPLKGGEYIGILLSYPDKKVCYYNILLNKNIKGMSATAHQVVVGVYAALFTLVQGNLKPKLYFTEDLADTIFMKFVTDNLKTNEIIIKNEKIISSTTIDSKNKSFVNRLI